MEEGRIQLSNEAFTTNNWFSYGRNIRKQHVHCVVTMDSAGIVVLKRRDATETQLSLCPVCTH